MNGKVLSQLDVPAKFEQEWINEQETEPLKERDILSLDTTDYNSLFKRNDAYIHHEIASHQPQACGSHVPFWASL